MASGKRVHALIFTSLPVEAKAVLSLLPADEAWGADGEWESKTGTIGLVRTVDGAHGPVRVVVIQVEASGDAAAAVLVEAAENLGPEYALFVGLANGARDVELGTVVAANKVYAYDRGADGRSFRTHPELGAGSYRLVRRAEAEALRSRWLSRLHAGSIPEKHPEAKVGPIAAGSPIVESSEGAVWPLLQQSYSDALAIETAGHGFLKGAHQAKLDAMVIRGISRLLLPVAGPKDDATAESEAARNAAAFAVEMLARLPLREDAGVESERPQEPAYDTQEQQRWAEELTEKNKEKKRLAIAGEDTSSVEKSILKLRRKLLDGPELPPGYTLAKGRFTLIRPLGDGGFGTVWEAWDDTDNTHVAVKVLHGRFSRDPTKRDRFFRGARIMDRLRHEAIVGIVHRKGSEDNYHYFAMDLHRGRLREAVRLGGLGRVEQANILVGVAAALGVAHKNGVIHRDVKPDNVLLDFELRPKLTDFDLVSVEGTLMVTEPSGMGSLGYSAPEVLHSGREATPQSDIFSLAATALFVLDGNDPPIEEIMRDPFGLVKRSRCPEPLKPVIARGLSWHPRDRHPSMEHFRAALERAFDAAALEGEQRKDDPQTIAARDTKRHVLALTDDEVEEILALAPPMVRSLVHPKSRPTRRRLDLGSMVDVIRSEETIPFLDRLEDAIRQHATTPTSGETSPDASGAAANVDWETLLETLARLPEDRFNEVVERASISAGTSIGAALRASSQWDAASDLTDSPWLDSRAMAHVKAELGPRQSLPPPPSTKERNAFAREALLHLKMFKVLDWIQRGNRAADAATNLDRLGQMLAERRYAELEGTMDTLADLLFASTSSAAFAMLGRLHTLASEASTLNPPPAVARVGPGWRADRMRIYRALNALSENEFANIVTRLSDPGALPSVYGPRALRSMGLVRFAERWMATTVLVKSLGLHGEAPGPTSIVGPNSGKEVATSAEAAEKAFESLPGILAEEVLFSFGVDSRQGSMLETLRALLSAVGADAMEEQLEALLRRLGGPDSDREDDAEEWSDEKRRTVLARLSQAGTDVITWVARQTGVPNEYLSPGTSRPDVAVGQLLDWIPLMPSELRRWIDAATMEALIVPYPASI